MNGRTREPAANIESSIALAGDRKVQSWPPQIPIATPFSARSTSPWVADKSPIGCCRRRRLDVHVPRSYASSSQLRPTIGYTRWNVNRRPTDPYRPSTTITTADCGRSVLTIVSTIHSKLIACTSRNTSVSYVTSPCFLASCTHAVLSTRTCLKVDLFQRSDRFGVFEIVLFSMQ